MGTYRRINVSSGRPLEHLAHYSRALRVGDMVLQSGTTAIDTDGNVIGVGDVAAQVDAIFEIAKESMGKAGGRLEDVVRSRIYLTDNSFAGNDNESVNVTNRVRKFYENAPFPNYNDFDDIKEFLIRADMSAASPTRAR